MHNIHNIYIINLYKSKVKVMQFANMAVVSLALLASTVFLLTLVGW